MSNKEIKELYQKYVDAINALKAAQAEAEEIRKSIPHIESSPNLIIQNIELQREQRRRLIANHAGDVEVLEIDNKIRELTLDLEKQRDIIAGVKQRYSYFLNKIIPQAIINRNTVSRECYEAVIDDLLSQISEESVGLVVQASFVACHCGLSYGGHSRFLQAIFKEPSSPEETEKINRELSKSYGIEF